MLCLSHAEKQTTLFFLFPAAAAAATPPLSRHSDYVHLPTTLLCVHAPLSLAITHTHTHTPPLATRARPETTTTKRPQQLSLHFLRPSTQHQYSTCSLSLPWGCTFFSRRDTLSLIGGTGHFSVSLSDDDDDERRRRRRRWLFWGVCRT